MQLDNQHLTIPTGILDKKTVKALDRRTSYLVDGYQFSPAFKKHRWDGRNHLLRILPSAGVMRVPAGLAEPAVEVLEAHGFGVVLEDWRRWPKERVKYPWSDSLRPHQLSAVEAAIAHRGPFNALGRGILDMAIRSGKTRTAAAIIAAFECRALFVVTSQLLLDQQHGALQDVLHTHVGMVGDGRWEPRDVTVAMVHTLARRWKSRECKALMAGADLVVFDECHHAANSAAWRRILTGSPGPYKLGLSGTVDLSEEEDGESDAGAIWLRAATGPVLYQVNASHLIGEGYLLRPDIRLYPVREPEGVIRRRWSSKLFNDLIHLNPARNQRIADIASDLVRKEKLTTLIVAERLEQIAMLVDMLRARGLTAAAVIGKTGKTDRKRLIGQIGEHVDVLVSNVMGEGVDLPNVEAVINAAGGRSAVDTVQRMRCLTPAEGKTKAVFVDFLDLTHPIVADHSQVRLATYRREPAFRLRLVS